MNRTPITQGLAYESQTENESSDACISSKERIYPRVAKNKDRKPNYSSSLNNENLWKDLSKVFLCHFNELLRR